MNRAIVVDPMMQTSAEGIYAAGDCCEGCDLMLGDTRNIGLYASAYVQGRRLPVAIWWVSPPAVRGQYPA